MFLKDSIKLLEEGLIESMLEINKSNIYLFIIKYNWREKNKKKKKKNSGDSNIN